MIYKVSCSSVTNYFNFLSVDVYVNVQVDNYMSAMTLHGIWEISITLNDFFYNLWTMTN